MNRNSRYLFLRDWMFLFFIGLILCRLLVLPVYSQEGVTAVSSVNPSVDSADGNGTFDYSQDKNPGDAAYQQKQFDIAASFYRKYRENAEKNSDMAALREAFQCEIDSLIFANLPNDAERTLAEYRRRGISEKQYQVDSFALDMWDAEILLLKHQAQKAGNILSSLLERMEKNDDPRKVRVMFKLAYSYELSGKHSEAAGIYKRVADFGAEKLSANSEIIRRAAECCILNLIIDSHIGEAEEMLNRMPDAGNKQDQTISDLLRFYLTLKKGGNSIAEDWNRIPARGENPLLFKAELKDSGFLAGIYGLIGLECEKTGSDKLGIAYSAYRAAYYLSVFEPDTFRFMESMLQVLEKMNQPEEAANLAALEYKLFSGARSSADMRFRIARIFIKSAYYTRANGIFQSIFSDRQVSHDDKKKMFADGLDLFLCHKHYEEAGKLVQLFCHDADALDALMYQKRIALCAGKKDLAVSLCRKIAVGFPESSVQAYTEAANLSYEMEKYSDVISFADHVLIQNPHAADVLFRRASSYEKLDHFAEAKNDYSAYIALPAELQKSSLLVHARFSLSRASIHLNDPYEVAICQLEQVFSEFPDDVLSRSSGYWLVRLYLLQGNISEAEKTAEVMGRRWPEDENTFHAFLNLAQKLHAAGNNEGALRFLQPLEKSEDIYYSSEAVYEKLVICFSQGKYDEAMNLFHVYENLPEEQRMRHIADACYYAGDMMKKNEKYTEAVSYYEKAALFAADSLIRQAQVGASGDCYFLLKQYDEALKKFEQLENTSDILPEYRAMAVYRIGRCHQLLNHEEEARKHYGKLPFLVPPEAVSEHPMEVIWIVRGINRMEEIALSDNHETVIHEALMMLEWIQKSGIQSISEIKNRRNALSKRGIFSLEQRLETQNK